MAGRVLHQLRRSTSFVGRPTSGWVATRNFQRMNSAAKSLRRELTAELARGGSGNNTASSFPLQQSRSRTTAGSRRISMIAPFESDRMRKEGRNREPTARDAEALA